MKVLSKEESKRISGADSCQCLDIVPKLDRNLKVIDISQAETKTFASLGGYLHAVLIDAISVNTDNECKEYCCEAIYHYTALSPTAMYKFGNNDATSCNRVV